MIKRNQIPPLITSYRFCAIAHCTLDVGARHLIGRYGEAVVEVPVSGAAALTDIDTPQALATIKAELEKT